ncbi:MAG: PadR family transcriptional regulator [Mycobacteriales bacterium]
MSTTRLMVLGAVRIFQPVHGYFLRQELLSWGVESWAHLHPGSIYNALRSSVRTGELAVVGTQSEGARPARTTYQLTTDGEKAFFVLLRDTLWNVDRWDGGTLLSGLTFVTALRRDEVIDAMHARQAGLRGVITEIEHVRRDAERTVHSPPQTRELWDAGASRLDGELHWCADFLGRLRDGNYRFYPEPGWDAGPDEHGSWYGPLDKRVGEAST